MVKMAPTDQQVIQEARNIVAPYDIKIPELALVNREHEDGVFVQAWVWVSYSTFGEEG